MEGWFAEKDGDLLIKIHVQPNSSKNEFAGIHNGSLKVRLTAPPVEGAANALLVKFIAKSLGVPKSSLSVISGEKSRQKTLKVDGGNIDMLHLLSDLHL